MTALGSILLTWGGKIAWGAVLVAVAGLLAGRLRSDKKRYLATLDNLELAATQAGAITGFPAALTQDLDRCRSFETYRRKAGELLNEAYRSDQWERYRKRLREVDRAWVRVEDAILADSVDAQVVRREREAVVVMIQNFKRTIRHDSRWRPSLLLFGPLPPADKN